MRRPENEITTQSKQFLHDLTIINLFSDFKTKYFKRNENYCLESDLLKKVISEENFKEIENFGLGYFNNLDGGEKRGRGIFRLIDTVIPFKVDLKQGMLLGIVRFNDDKDFCQIYLGKRIGTGEMAIVHSDKIFMINGEGYENGHLEKALHKILRSSNEDFKSESELSL